jgi:hypothetical protein
MMCRRLVEAGIDPGSSLEAWRGDTMALRVRRIGEAAELEINSKGTGFIRRPEVRRASPSAKKRPDAPGGHPPKTIDPAARDRNSTLGGESLVPVISNQRDRLSATLQKDSGIVAPDQSPRASYLVDRQQRCTVSPHGIHGAEIDRLSAALHFMSGHCRERHRRLWWLSTDKGTPRQWIADIQKRVTRLQKKLHLPGYNVTVF